MCKNKFYLFVCQKIIQIIHFFKLKELITIHLSIYKHQLHSIHFFKSQLKFFQDYQYKYIKE